MAQTNTFDWTDWRTRVLVPILEDRLEAMAADPEVALLSADTDRTQEYVFESARLPEIRGASVLLDQLNREKTETLLSETFHLPKDCIVYAGGGSLLAVVPASIAANVAQAIELLYPCVTGSATITTAIYRPQTVQEFRQGFRSEEFALEQVQAFGRAGLSEAEWARIVNYYERPEKRDGMIDPGDYQSRKHFGELVALLGMKLRAAKEQKRWVPFYESLPFTVRCESCGIRPASVAIRTPEGDERQICVVCERKQEDRRQVKTQWAVRFLEGLPKIKADLILQYNPDRVDWDSVQIAQDIGEIAQCSSRSGFVGFIYADGNGIGKHMESQTSITAYRAESKRIVDATENAVYQALAENLTVRKVTRSIGGKKPQVLIHPFEIITIGGDDVLLVVPGDVALPIAARICQLFGQRAAPLTMSAGAVIADESNPVRFLHDLAQQLLKESVKPRLRKTPALDWIVLTSQSTLQTSIDGLRESPPYKLSTEEVDKFLWLTGRPFTLDETLKILRLLRAMRQARFPTSQLHTLADTLPEGRQRASLFYVYQQARLRGERSRVLNLISEEWGLDPKKDPIPWQVQIENKKPVGFRTILRDLVELYDFVPRSSGAALDTLWQPLLAKEV